MNNSNVEQLLNTCSTDINQVKIIIDGLGIMSNIVPYLTKYALVRACGTIEIAYKSIIADYCSFRSKKQIKNYINAKVRETSSNPSYDKINYTLTLFDTEWADDFRNSVSSHPRNTELRTSLQSLVDARNDFAHGGDPTATIEDILNYFEDSYEIINLLDQIIN